MLGLPRRSCQAPKRGSILNDSENLMRYRSTGKDRLPKTVRHLENDDYEEVDSVLTEDNLLENRRRSESDLFNSVSFHCYDEIDEAELNISEISPYSVGPVSNTRAGRVDSVASRISQDSGAFCDEVPPPLPRKPRSIRRRYANVYEFEKRGSIPPPLPPRRNESPPPPPSRIGTASKLPSPLHLNLALPGLNPVGRKNLLSKYIEETSKKRTPSRRRRTLHNFGVSEDSNKENNVSSPTVSSKKKFKFFGSKTPAPEEETSPVASPRRKKIFRNSILSSSVRRKKTETVVVSSSRRRRSSLLFGPATVKSVPTTPGKCEVSSSSPSSTEEIISSSTEEDFSHCIRDALKEGLPVIPFHQTSKASKPMDLCYSVPPPLPLKNNPCCCCNRSLSCAPSSSTGKSLENIVGEAQKEIEDEEKRLVAIMMRHADLLLTPKVIREALKKNKSLESSEESEYLDMNQARGILKTRNS